MKFVLQRVKEAAVTVAGKVIGQIGKGLLVFIGIEKGDDGEDVDYFVKKIFELRLFEDQNGKMNLGASDVHAEFLVVSQFTLLGDCSKGRRPSFDKAADPQTAIQLYEYFVNQIRHRGLKVETGEFQAMMDVSLVNDGPVTFILEGKRRKDL